MTHTVDTLMALADEYTRLCTFMQDGTTAESAKTAREALRTALTEALKNQQNLDTSQERVQNSPESVHIAQPTAMPFVPWSKEAEMLEAWTNKTAADTEILARGRFHAFKGEDGEPDDWEWFEAGTGCEDGCVDAVIVRADSIQAAQPVWGPAEVASNRKAFKEYLADCEKCAIVPDIAGAFNAGWGAQPVLEPLTDETVRGFSEDIWGSEIDYQHTCEIEFARAIERAHGIGGDK